MTSTKVATKQTAQPNHLANIMKLGKSKTSDFVPEINEKIQRLMCIEDLRINNVAVIGYN